jgi:hypothetical protein
MGIVAAGAGVLMTERRLQWVLTGTAAVLALYWFHLAWAPSPAMETDWPAPPVTYADAAPAVEPPPTPVRAEAGVVSTDIVAPSPVASSWYGSIPRRCPTTAPSRRCLCQERAQACRSPPTVPEAVMSVPTWDVRRQWGLWRRVRGR